MSWHKGTDHVFSFTVYVENTTAEAIANGTAVCRDVTGWTTQWHLRTHVDNPTATLTKAGAVVGVFNASPALNTQRIEATVDDLDTDNLEARDYVHGLKRTDPGFEWIVCEATPITLLESPVR